MVWHSIVRQCQSLLTQVRKVIAVRLHPCSRSSLRSSVVHFFLKSFQTLGYQKLLSTTAFVLSRVDIPEGLRLDGWNLSSADETIKAAWSLIRLSERYNLSTEPGTNEDGERWIEQFREANNAARKYGAGNLWRDEGQTKGAGGERKAAPGQKKLLNDTIATHFPYGCRLYLSLRCCCCCYCYHPCVSARARGQCLLLLVSRRPGTMDWFANQLALTMASATRIRSLVHSSGRDLLALLVDWWLPVTDFGDFTS